jgi:hypothetical protein
MQRRWIAVIVIAVAFGIAWWWLGGRGYAEQTAFWIR